MRKLLLNNCLKTHYGAFISGPRNLFGGKIINPPKYMSSGDDGGKFWLVSYDYNSENILERRAPLRPSHLALAKEYVAAGKLLLGGAFADPIDGAALIFKGTKEEVTEFVKKDPYVTQGIVTQHRIREWTVVVGALV